MEQAPIAAGPLEASVRGDMHCLKTWPAFFAAVVSGEKPFEVRKADRDFRVGDVLVLQEWNPEIEQYTGAMIAKKVTYILDGGAFGLERGFVCMGLTDITPNAELMGRPLNEQNKE